MLPKSESLGCKHGILKQTFQIVKELEISVFNTFQAS